MLRLLAFLACLWGAATAAPRVFTVDDALAIKTLSDPRISPDGKWVAYVVEKNDLDKDEKTSRIYMTSIDGETTLAMTGETYSASDPRWSPGGRYLSFIAARGDLDGNAASQVFTLDRRGGEAEAYTNVPQGVIEHEWAPSGDRLLLAIADESAHEKAAREALEKGGNEPVLPVVIDRLQFKEDGVGYLDRSRRHYYVQEGRLGERNQLTFGDYDDYEAVWSPDGASIYALYEHDGEQPLVAIDARTGAKRDLIAGEHAIYDFDIHASGAVVAQLARPTLPDEIFASSGGALTQVTKTNDALLRDVKLSSPFTAKFKSADGTEIEAFFYPPAQRRARKAPTLLRIHGGPTSQFDFSFDAYAQLYAANGYAVVMPNPRGSTGFGTDFAAAIYADWGNKDFDDVMAATDHAIAIGLADGKRLGVGGWSYGGILTNYVVTKTDRFDAAVTGASGFNHLANYGHDIYQREYEIELGLPWENPESWNRVDAFKGTANVTTPTLFIGGADDWNVPIHNSEQFYQILKRRGVPTGLIVYPGEDHSIDRPSFYKDRFERYLGWYEKWVK